MLERTSQKRTNGTDRYAGSAELAIQSTFKFTTDLCFYPSVNECQRSVTNNFVADTHTFAAEYTTVHIALDQWVVVVYFMLEFLVGKTVAVNLVIVS